MCCVTAGLSPKKFFGGLVQIEKKKSSNCKKKKVQFVKCTSILDIYNRKYMMKWYYWCHREWKETYFVNLSSGDSKNKSLKKTVE